MEITSFILRSCLKYKKNWNEFQLQFANDIIRENHSRMEPLLYSALSEEYA